jgi:hypothetical protein
MTVHVAGGLKVSQDQLRRGRGVEGAQPRTRQSVALGAVSPPAFGNGLKSRGSTPARTGPGRTSAFHLESAPPEALLVPLLELATGMCAWPFGESPYLYCGAPVDPCAPSRQRRRYCRFHGDRATATAAPGKALTGE